MLGAWLDFHEITLNRMNAPVCKSHASKLCAQENIHFNALNFKSFSLNNKIILGEVCRPVELLVNMNYLVMRNEDIFYAKT